MLQKSLVLNISKIAKPFKFENPNSVNMKEFINFYDKAFYAYWQSIHSMLKAVVYDVNCTSDAYKISFNVIFNFIEYIITCSLCPLLLTPPKLVLQLSSQNPINLSFSFVWSRTESRYSLNILAVSPGTDLNSKSFTLNATFW